VRFGDSYPEVDWFGGEECREVAPGLLGGGDDGRRVGTDLSWKTERRERCAEREVQMIEKRIAGPGLRFAKVTNHGRRRRRHVESCPRKRRIRGGSRYLFPGEGMSYGYLGDVTSGDLREAHGGEA